MRVVEASLAPTLHLATEPIENPLTSADGEGPSDKHRKNEQGAASTTRIAGKAAALELHPAGTRGKRRGFSPGAVACHSQSARVHTDSRQKKIEGKISLSRLNKHQNNTNCGSAFEPGASELPYYCTSVSLYVFLRC